MSIRRINMKLIAIALTAVVLLATLASAQLPDSLALHQNEPDPFCVDDLPGKTAIRFELPQALQTRLEVWNPDTTYVVRTLIEGHLAAGVYEIVWDGRDALGEFVEAGAYPYTMTVSFDIVSFEIMRVATMSCDTPVRESTWGAIKAWFRKPERPTSKTSVCSRRAWLSRRLQRHQARCGCRVKGSRRSLCAPGPHKPYRVAPHPTTARSGTPTRGPRSRVSSS